MRTCGAQSSSKEGLARPLECSVAKPKVRGALPRTGMSLYQYLNQADSLGGSLRKGWPKYEGDSRYRGPTAFSTEGLNNAF